MSYILRKEFQIWCVDASWGGSVVYHFGITVTLTYGLVSRVTHLWDISPIYWREESQIWCVDASLEGGVMRTILVTLALTSDLIC